jgi:glycosyltransferase involved in cell wall biosynthesis
MIVWNEEDLLPLALANIKKLADEIVIFDTGSSDNTVEIAKKLGARVFEGGDRMNKAASRNQAQDKAIGDWIVILDADERIADPVGLKKFLEKTDAQSVYIRLQFLKNEKPTLSYQQMRCWRKGTFKYKYRAHEVPIPVDGWGKIAHTDFIWEHRPPSERKWKLQYTLDRLLMDVEENPNSARQKYYLGRQYMYLMEWENAIKYLKEYLDQPGIDAADAWYNLSHCYSKLDQIKKRDQSLYQACAAMPNRREWWCQLAENYYAQGQFSLALGLLKCAEEIEIPAQSYTHHYWYGANFYDLLSRCYWKLKRYNEGYQYAIKALELDSENQRLKDNLAWFETKIGNDNFLGINFSIPKGLKILMLGYEDYSGKAEATKQAWNKYSQGEAKLVTYHESYLRYPRDIYRPSNEELKFLVGWADLIHIFDWLPFQAINWGKPLVITYSGKFYRENYEEWNLRDKNSGIFQLCSTLDLTFLGAEWCPRPIDLINITKERNKFFVVGHAPTRRNENKGTEEIIRQLSDLPGIKLEIIEGVNNKICLNRKAQVDIYIDQFLMGYGTNALESWAMGIPVLAGIKDQDFRELVVSTIGYLPFEEVDFDNLKDIVNLLRFDVESYKKAQKKGYQYIKDFHHPEKIVQKLENVYREVLENPIIFFDDVMALAAREAMRV